MALRHDLTALLLQLSRPRYGEELRFLGQDLPKPRRERVRTRHGVVRCWRYHAQDGAGPGTYVHFHGGAFVMRHPKMDDFWARYVVAQTGLDVVLPDYSVAPQRRYPVAQEQAHDVVAALAVQGPLSVGGFSAGGSLAASAALQVRDRESCELRFQLLGVPSLDVVESVEEKCATAPSSMITPRLLDLVRGSYYRDVARRREPYASPVMATNLQGLAPAMVVTAERDALRREGDRYAEKLRQDGVPVQHVVASGVDHYFLHGAGEQRARALMTQMATAIAQGTSQPRA